MLEKSFSLACVFISFLIDHVSFEGKRREIHKLTGVHFLDGWMLLTSSVEV
jgi:hypothetical protein